MNYKPLLLIVIVLSLTALACGVSIDLPITDVKTGPTVTEDIRIEVPEVGEPVDVTLAFGAGELDIQPGAGNTLIEGTASYNIEDFKPEIMVSGSSVRLETGNLEISGIPTFGDKFKNEWDLRLGDAPMNLVINSGAYNGNIDLGGLSLLSLEVTDGAADVDLRFSRLNQVEMDTLRYQTGASSVSLRGLANANFDRMIFKSGAGDYTLDFSGDLQRDMDVSIDSGMSSIEIIVPRGVPVEVRYDGGLSNVDYSGDWQRSGNDYYQDGSGPGINININLGAGDLRLRNR
jgi:hypothetical protein